MSSNLHEASERLRQIRPDYAWDEDILAADDTRVDAVKCVIDRQLTTADRTIILLYIDCQSYRELGRLLGFSQTTAWKEVRRIRSFILKQINRTKK